MSYNRRKWLTDLVLLTACLAGCTGAGEIRSTPKVSAPLLGPTMLEGHGLAILTPVTGPDREQDRHAVALLFASRLADMRSEVHIVPLSQTLGAVNRAGLARQYRKLYEDYRTTGLLDRDTLAKLRGVTGAQYFLLLQLGEYAEASPARSGPAVRLRLAIQVWDSSDGTIAWEGIDEVTQTSGVDATPNFSSLVERAATDLISRMP